MIGSHLGKEKTNEHEEEEEAERREALCLSDDFGLDVR